jgi:transcriptional regulator with XRE-family HTH domain
MSQIELAGRAGVSRAAISRLEIGRAAPTLRTAHALSQALGYPVEVVFGGPASGPVEIVRDG